jgi:hypothetical protein
LIKLSPKCPVTKIPNNRKMKKTKINQNILQKFKKQRNKQLTLLTNFPFAKKQIQQNNAKENVKTI